MKLDIGCGHSKKEGFFGIDCRPLEGVDLVCDCNLPIPLPDNCADEINADDFLEHINNDKRIHIMNEIWRLLKPNGIFNSSTPSTDGRGAFQDPTHYCYSDDTEVLTDNGWKLIKDVVLNEYVITINPETMLAEYQPVIQLNNYDYNGKMINFKTKSVDLCVTPNHKMLFRVSGNVSSYRFKEAKDFLGKSNKSYVFNQKVMLLKEPDIVDVIEIPDLYDGYGNKWRIKYPATPLMKLIGWYVAEGSTAVIVNKDNSRYNQYRVDINQSPLVNPEKYEIIKNVVLDLGLTPVMTKKSIAFSEKGLAIYLKTLGKQHERFIPVLFKNQNKLLLKELLDAALMGDGTNNGTTSFTYASISRTLANDISEIAQKCGYRATQLIEKRNYYKKILSEKAYFCKDIYLVIISKNTNLYSRFIETNYKGKVYCLGVNKYHTLFVRRKGRAVWSGNSQWNQNSFWYYTSDFHRNLSGITAKFDIIQLETTAKDANEVCHVLAVLKAVK